MAAQLKYKEVEKEMRQLALTLPPGAKIPPERHLAVTYQCNFLTIRKALKGLVDDGTIFRRVGSGSFVAERQGTIGKYPPLAKGKRIGLFVYHKSDAYAQKILQGLSYVAMEKKFELRSAWVQDFGEESVQQAHNFSKEGCSALILPWFPLHMTKEISGFIQKCPLPVCIPLLIPGLENNYFGKPELFGMGLISSLEALYRYFQKLGHHHIAILGPAMPQDPVLQTMLSAYACLTQTRDLPHLCGLVAPGTLGMDDLVKRWKIYQGKLAVISYDDEHALRFMTAMHKIGLSAPHDFNIIGNNDTDASHFSDPPLSTISQDFHHIGRNLLKKAYALAQGREFHDEAPPISHVLVRDTCGGNGKINDAFREEFPDLDFVLNVKDHKARV